MVSGCSANVGYGYGDFLVLGQVNRFQGTENTVFINRLQGFAHLAMLKVY
jgi:hypothetical protein